MAKKEPRQLSLFSNIEMYNLSVDRTNTIRRLGRNGILYEYEMPYGADIRYFYEEALNVKSIKGNNTNPSTSKKRKGHIYPPGSYQPIGDKRYFTYYQLKKMTRKDKENWMMELYIKELIKEYMKALKEEGL